MHLLVQHGNFKKAKTGLYKEAEEEKKSEKEDNKTKEDPDFDDEWIPATILSVITPAPSLSITKAFSKDVYLYSFSYSIKTIKPPCF
jgi:hypothetical protein